MKKICINCGNEFPAKRITAKFCCNKCKKYYNRNKVSVPENKVSVPENKVSVPSSTLKEVSGTKMSR